jgi:hypothetical protein
MKQRYLILGLPFIIFVGSLGVASATCVQDGKVARIRSGITSNQGEVVDIGPSITKLANFPTFYVFYTIPSTNLRFYSMLASAAASHMQVELTGDAPTCPTTGFFRDGGNLLGVDLRVNQ